VKISELITSLQELQTKHGDVPVFHWDDWAEFLITKAEYQKAVTDSDEYNECDRVLIGGSSYEEKPITVWDYTKGLK